jgi:hypothetical protein
MTVSLRPVSFVVVALVFVLVPGRLSAAPATHTPSSGSVVLGDAVVGEGKAAVTLAVSVGACARAKGAPKDAPAECVLTVAATKGGAGRADLQWRVKAGAIARPNAFVAVVGDDPEQRMTLRWRALQLGDPRPRAGAPALIVTQETHGERSKRRHDVFAVRGGRLQRVFTADEGRGRTWSALEAADLDGDGGSELVLQRSSTPDEEQPDRWSLEVYGWRSDIGKIIPRNDRRPQVKGAVIGMFKTALEARKLAGQGCTLDYLVLDHTSLDLLQPGQIVVTQPFVRREDGELALEELRACNAALAGGVKPLAAGVDVDVGGH